MLPARRSGHQPPARREPTGDAAGGNAGEGGGTTGHPNRAMETAAAAYELGRLYRAQLTPWAALGGTWTLGAVAGAAPGGYTLIPLGVGLAAAAAGCAHQFARAGQKTTRAYPIARAWRAYIAAAGSAAVGWLSAAAATGAAATSTMTGVLLALGAGLGIPWWREHAAPDPDVTAEAEAPAPEPEPEPDRPDPRVQLWDTHLPAYGAITGLTDFELGWRARVRVPHRHTYKTLTHQNFRDEFASVYGLPDGRVYPAAVPDADVRQAEVTVLTTDPLRRITRWAGPGLDHDEGTFPLMRAMDGSMLPFRFFLPGGGCAHAFVAGTTRSGKSTTLNLVVAEAAISPVLIPIVIDVGAVSLPFWTDHALFADTHADAAAVIDYLFGVIEARAGVLRARKGRGGGSLTPSRDMPGFAVVLDEAHNVLVGNSGLQRRVERLTQEGAKYGISVTLGNQDTNVAQLGGAGTTMRNMLKSGTIVAHRTMETGSSNRITVAEGPPEKLSALPAYWPDGSQARGLGYMLSAPPLMRARSMLIDLDADSPGNVAAQVAAQVTHPQLDPDTARVPGPTLDGATAEPEPAPAGPPPTEGGRAGGLAPVGDGDAAAINAVQDALEAGTPADVAELRTATGLPTRQVRQALQLLN